MCNGWNHVDGCDCGFGPPYDRNIPEYFDERVGSEGGQNLSSAGPKSAKLAKLIDNGERTTQLVSTFLWQSYMGQRTPRRIGRFAKSGAAEAPTVWVIRHGKGFPRHDLLIFDPIIPPNKVEQGIVEITPENLRRGWRTFRDAYSITHASMPRWLSGLSLQDIPDIAVEAMSKQRHSYIAMHPPRIVWTVSSRQTPPRISSHALAVSNRVEGKGLSTAGVISADTNGRTGVTTALHALKELKAPVFVEGLPGMVRTTDILTDSCFIEIEDSKLPLSGMVSGPLSGKTPGRGESVSFEGIASGKVTTYVDGWTFELPFIAPGITQSKIMTPAVTDEGDSGAALVNQLGEIIGFAHYRTGFNVRSPHSAWIWAESVFVALRLQ